MEPKTQTLKSRHRIFRETREFFEGLDFIEVHTPLLVQNPGLEPYLIPFETHFVPGLGGGTAQTWYLPTSPEYHLKKALALGLPRIFEITKSFRNAELSREHEPEFFMLEWYRHPGGYQDIAQDLRALLARLGEVFAPTQPWHRAQDLTVNDAFKKYCGLDLAGAIKGHAPSLTTQAVTAGFASVRVDDDFETTFHKLMVERIERELGFGGPLFLWDYPASMSALSKAKPEDPFFCERFEVYWQGIELANAFGELTDPLEQRRRSELDQAQRLKLYGKTPPLDEAFLSALAQLKHPAGGIAVGFDRLIQCLLGKDSLQQIIAFPHVNSL